MGEIASSNISAPFAWGIEIGFAIARGGGFLSFWILMSIEICVWNARLFVGKFRTVLPVLSRWAALFEEDFDIMTSLFDCFCNDSVDSKLVWGLIPLTDLSRREEEEEEDESRRCLLPWNTGATSSDPIEERLSRQRPKYSWHMLFTFLAAIMGSDGGAWDRRRSAKFISCSLIQEYNAPKAWTAVAIQRRIRLAGYSRGFFLRAGDTSASSTSALPYLW